MIYPQPIVNPGGETGDASGWTVVSGSLIADTVEESIVPYAGSYFLRGSGSTHEFYQEIVVDAARHADIDNNLVAYDYSVQHTGHANGVAQTYLEFYNGAAALVRRDETPEAYKDSWTELALGLNVPPGTRTIRIGCEARRTASISFSSSWDVFSLDLVDDPTASIKSFQSGVQLSAGSEFPFVQARQAGIYSLVSRPAEQLHSRQSAAVVVAAAETSNGNFDVYTHQLGVYVLVKGRPDTRKLRAWTFTQDDHDFYVLHLGSEKTLIIDMMTNQWSSWRSKGKAIWRASVGLGWEQDNIGGDVTVGLLWNIDPAVRDDDDVGGLAADRFPIETIVRGMYPMRLRNSLSCYRATITMDGSPVADGVGVTLRTSDDFGRTWVNHGEKLLIDVSRLYEISWVGLGLITAPGRLFEIIDTGYIHRLDALDVDLGEDEGRGE